MESKRYDDMILLLPVRLPGVTTVVTLGNRTGRRIPPHQGSAAPRQYVRCAPQAKTGIRERPWQSASSANSRTRVRVRMFSGRRLGLRRDIAESKRASWPSYLLV